MGRRNRPIAARPGDAAPVVADSTPAASEPVVDAVPGDAAPAGDVSSVESTEELRAQVTRLEAALAAAIERGQKDLDDQTARFNARWAEREAEIAAARAAHPKGSHGPSGEPRGMRALVLNGIFYRGKQHEPGTEMPFDPEAPPADLATRMVEGIHYVWSR
jgi:hypothetical protein